jgi:hypothetical protein
MKRSRSNGQDRGQVKRLVILLLCAVVITADTIGGQYLRSRQWLTKEKRKRKPNRIFNYS